MSIRQLRQNRQRAALWQAMVLGFALIAAGCGSGGSSESPGSGSSGAAPSTEIGRAPSAGKNAAAVAPPIVDAERPSQDQLDPVLPGAPRSQAIILNANVTLEVGTNLTETMDSLQMLADRYQGFVAESRHSGQEPGYREGYAVLRVPSRHFQAVLAELAELGTVTNRHTYTEDVGDQLVDLEARQTTAEQREQRLLELIDQATEITDLIALESELARVRSEIEMLAAQRKKLRDLVDYSTFTIHLYEVAPGQEPARPVTVWERTVLAFERGLANAGNFASGLLVFTVSVLPVLVVIAVIVVPIWWGIRALRRLIRRRRPSGPPAAPDSPGDDS